MVETRDIGGFSDTSVVVSLVAVPVITVTGTCSIIVVIWTTTVASFQSLEYC